MEGLTKKAEGGARFFITPPIFNLGLLEPYQKRIDRQKMAIIPTVLLLKSLGMARYMVRNLPQVDIPEAVLDRIGRAPDKVRACIEIAAETLSELKARGFSGAYVATLGWENRLPEIIEAI
jgi:methylenetetrahydrofolate reductase (NADPH)